MAITHYAALGVTQNATRAEITSAWIRRGSGRVVTAECSCDQR